jgi:hypothetical protein
MMKIKVFTVKKTRAVLLAGVMVVLPLLGQAAPVAEHPSGGAMVGDLLVARPLGLVLFGLGSAVYVATLPFSLLGGNAGEAGNQLVLQPAKEVFVRCLGCVRSGRKESLSN